MDIRKKIKLQIDDKFFLEEIRCEYLVTEKQKKVWAVELDLLNELLIVCKKHEIKVHVFAGSLLGTVRHKGFIPWDDDIDVCMTRPEFEKFLKVAPLEFKHPYFLQTALSDREYFFAYARLRNSLTTGYVTEYSEGEYNQGIFIDVFVLDGYIENEKLFKKQMKYRSVMLKLAQFYRDNYIKSNPIKIMVSRLLKTLLPYEEFVEKYYKNITRYNSQTQRLSMITHSFFFISRYYCMKSDLDNTIYMDFEGLKVPVPAEYKTILKNTYGNYMELPPIEKRGMWHSGQIVYDPDTPYKDFVKKCRRKSLE